MDKTLGFHIRNVADDKGPVVRKPINLIQD